MITLVYSVNSSIALTDYIEDFRKNPVGYLKELAYIEVCGKELSDIRFKFRYHNGRQDMIMTIPCNISAKTMYWYGDIAKTILLNLYL